MAPAKKRSLPWLVLVVALALTVALHPFWLRALGDFLVRSEEPYPADLVVTLAGDVFGNRILKAAELVRMGYAPKVLVSSGHTIYGFHESELAIRFAVQQGYDESIFDPVHCDCNSTREEAAAILPQLAARGVRRFLLVTSDYHTRRASAIFRSLCASCQFRVIAAPDRYFRAESWWRSRNGRKLAFLEAAKTVAEWLGL